MVEQDKLVHAFENESALLPSSAEISAAIERELESSIGWVTCSLLAGQSNHLAKHLCRRSHRRTCADRKSRCLTAGRAPTHGSRSPGVALGLPCRTLCYGPSLLVPEVPWSRRRRATGSCLHQARLDPCLGLSVVPRDLSEVKMAANPHASRSRRARSFSFRRLERTKLGR